MTKLRKLTIAASLLAVALTIALCWPKPKGYTYQGKTVEQWFGSYFKRGQENDAYFAFRDGIGTNAVPFLVDRITRDFKPSPTERLASLLPAHYQPLQGPSRLARLPISWSTSLNHRRACCGNY